MWPGKPLYLAVTSGTTSGSKYIPITNQSLPNHLNGAKTALLMYVAETGKTDFVNGKFIFIQGSPILTKISGILSGRLFGYLSASCSLLHEKKHAAIMEYQLVDDWETKVKMIVEETVHENMTIISGIPSWLQMYFEKIAEKQRRKFRTFSKFQPYDLWRSKF